MTMIKKLKNWKTWLIGLLIPMAFAGGIVDSQINPYITTEDGYEMALTQTLPESGETKIELSKVEPKVILGKWNNEVRLGIKYQGIDSTTKGKRPLLTNRIEWKDDKGKEKLHAYPLEAGEGMEDGGLELEIVLNEKPDTNVFDFTIDGAENLDFFYQPVLTQEEITEGASRPDNVIGSYAVYHKTKANHRVGSTNYATGKAYHIYRPRAIDANGVEVWAELLYENGILSITVPQKFLNDAVYPVIVDPTFGFTSIGTTQAIIADNTGWRIRGTTYTSPEAGTVSTLQAYLTDVSASGGDLGFAYALYQKSDDSLLAQSTESTFDNVTGWHELNVSSSITAQDYVLVMQGGDLTSGNYTISHDAVSVVRYFKSNSTIDLPFPNPFDGTIGAANFKYSIYATYTAVVAPVPQLLTLGVG